MIFGKLLFGLVVGFGLTMMHNPTGFFTPKWRLIVRFVLGWIGLLPVVLAFVPEEHREMVAKAHLTAAAIGGSGVVLGYMRQELEEPNE